MQLGRRTILAVYGVKAIPMSLHVEANLIEKLLNIVDVMCRGGVAMRTENSQCLN